MGYFAIGFLCGMLATAAGVLLKAVLDGRAPAEKKTERTKEELEKEQRKAEQWENLMGYTGPRR